MFVFATDICLLMRIIQLREIDVQNGEKRQGLAGSEKGRHIGAERGTVRADTEVHGVAGGDMVSYSISVESEARSLSVERGGRRNVNRFRHWG